MINNFKNFKANKSKPGINQNGYLVNECVSMFDVSTPNKDLSNINKKGRVIGNIGTVNNCNNFSLISDNNEMQFDTLRRYFEGKANTTRDIVQDNTKSELSNSLKNNSAFRLSGLSTTDVINTPKK